MFQQSLNLFDRDRVVREHRIGWDELVKTERATFTLHKSNHLVEKSVGTNIVPGLDGSEQISIESMQRLFSAMGELILPAPPHPNDHWPVPALWPSCFGGSSP